MDSKDWLLKQLDMTEEQLYSTCRQRDLVNKRWVMMWFYRVAGKSFPFIGKKMKRNNATIVSACKNAPATIKALAEELLMLYATEVAKTPIHFEPTAKPKVKIKVPDYHQNTTKYVEVDADSIKPIKKIRSWDL